MSTQKQEDYGIHYRKKGCYSLLQNTYTYSCPPKNNTYRGINNGVNCLCAKPQRSSMDRAMMSGKKWPVSNARLGWS